MKVELPKGKYVLAVSGGIDSMVLLDILAERKDVELVVAHFDHGIRPDSHKDAELVEKTAKKYGLRFELGSSDLGADASEDEARQARYGFLEYVLQKYQAEAIITAHHRDDLLETALINILRGTGPQGLIAMKQNRRIIRPLLDVPKSGLTVYARKKGLVWREDSTNADEKYLRNYLRKKVITKLSAAQRQLVLDNIDKVAKSATLKSDLVAAISRLVMEDKHLSRTAFAGLPVDIGNEVLYGQLSEMGVDFDRPMVEKLNVIIRTAAPGTVHDISGGWVMKLDKDQAKIIKSPRVLHRAI